MSPPCWRWSALVILLVAATTSAAAQSPDGTKLHHHMSIDDIRRTFHVDSHDDVPEYEVVAVRAVSKRSAGQESDEPSLVASLEAFGRPLQLALQRTTTLSRAGPPSALRMWAADSRHPDGVHLTEIPQDEHSEDIGHTYQDEQTGAALLVHRDPEDGTLIVEGTIGSDFVVRPVPSNIRHLAPPPPPHEDDEDPNDDEMFLDEEPGQEEAVSSGFPLPPEKPRKSAAIKKASQQTLEKKQSGAKSRVKRSAASVGMHVVIKRAEHVATTEDPLSDYAFMEPDHISKRFKRRAVRRSSSSSRQRRQGREAPYVIYPEILVIVDYDGYRLHGGDNVQIKRYFVSFWNGVDLRYKLLKGPKVRISIAGIIISRGRDATPYLERNRVGRDAIDSAAALTDMGKYLFRERRLPVYDIAVAITKYDMCRRRKGGRCTKGTAGMLLSAPDVHQQ